MFIEYEIKEEDGRYMAIINCDRITGIMVEDEYFLIVTNAETTRFFNHVFVLYDAFKRALCGESVTIEGIGYVRPLTPYKDPGLLPMTYFNWRDHA